MIRISSLRYGFDNGFVAEDQGLTLAEMLQPESWAGGKVEVAEFGIVAGIDGWAWARVRGKDHEGRPLLELAAVPPADATIKAPKGRKE